MSRHTIVVKAGSSNLLAGTAALDRPNIERLLNELVDAREAGPPRHLRLVWSDCGRPGAARLQQAASHHPGPAGVRRRRAEPADAGVQRDPGAARLRRRAAAADARRLPGSAALPESAEHAGRPPRAQGHPRHQRERHDLRRRDPLRRQRHPRGVRLERGGRHADRHPLGRGRPLHRQPEPRSDRPPHPRGGRGHPGDRGAGRTPPTRRSASAG